MGAAHPRADPMKTNKETAEVLGTFFESVFVVEREEELPEFADRFPKGQSLGHHIFKRRRRQVKRSEV